jgi:hypothetical protein
MRQLRRYVDRPLGRGEPLVSVCNVAMLDATARCSASPARARGSANRQASPPLGSRSGHAQRGEALGEQPVEHGKGAGAPSERILIVV